VIRWLLALTLSGACLVGGTVFVVSSKLNSATQPEAAEKIFEVKPGASLHRVTLDLTEAGLVNDGWFGARGLVAYARIYQLERGIKSGEYRLSAAMSPTEILDQLISGNVATYPVTIPPGFNLWEIAARLEAEELIQDADAFLALVSNPEFTRSLEIEADTLEGYLYPETYQFQKHTPDKAVAETLVEQFRRALTRQDQERLAKSGRTLHQVVTLASVVEKETGAAPERPRIAGVFENRLKRGMMLQSDPTVIYGILVTRGEFDGNIRRRDLREDTPYNTYTRTGMPPGPIASPGIDAIRAVLAPEEHKYLYFVSMNNGTHQFSKTLREHNRAVDRYQRLRTN
jgi:UPF0755 protein